MAINNRQARLSDFLQARKDPYIADIYNDYEFAGKILEFLAALELDDISTNPDDHDCRNDRFGSGLCDHPSHNYELLDQRPLVA